MGLSSTSLWPLLIKSCTTPCIQVFLQFNFNGTAHMIWSYRFSHSNYKQYTMVVHGYENNMLPFIKPMPIVSFQTLQDADWC